MVNSFEYSPMSGKQQPSQSTACMFSSLGSPYAVLLCLIKKHINYVRSIMQECPKYFSNGHKVTFIVWLVTTLANLAWSTVFTVYHASHLAMAVTPGCNGL